MTRVQSDIRESTSASGAPAVSVIVAVCNRADFLEKVFLSLINQTLSDFEVIIADDGSGPEIAECVGRYSPRFARPIRHVWQQHNGFRKTVIVNNAVREASAGYLLFIDGDCILHRRFVESHYRHRKPRAVLGGRRVMLDEPITSRLTKDDIASGRLERPWFWWNHCARGDRKHGVYVPFLFTVSNLRKKGYSMFGSNFSLFKEDFCSVNGYDETIIGRGMEDENLRERLKLSGVSIRSVTREAIQYHLFHTSAPVPHSKESVAAWCFPKQAWAARGIATGR